MIRQLFSELDSTVYVQIWENRIKAADMSTGKTYDDSPLIAIKSNKKGKKIVLAIGIEAKTKGSDADVEIINPFSHPRTLVSDFLVGEKIMQHVMHSLFVNKFITPAPKVVVHPMEKLNGGLTSIEAKAFTEMVIGAGAREAVLHQGPELWSSTFNFADIKAAADRNESSNIELKSKKENYFGVLFWIAILVAVIWFGS